MRSFRLFSPFSTLLLVSAVTACGGGSSDKPDAFVVVVDAPPDSPPPPPGCEYGELRDDTNDDYETQTGSAEEVNVPYGGTMVLCGTVHSNHFADGAIDNDSYAVTVPNGADVYVTLTGAGLEAIEDVSLEVWTGQSFGDFVSSGGFAVNHSATSIHLDAGSYEFSMRAYAAAAITTPVSYKIRIVPDMPLTRCGHLTTGGFAEAGDGGANLGNDMVAVDDNAATGTPTRTFTLATDAPEATGLTIAPDMKYRVSGTSAGNAVMGTYRDRDTYEFTTGATTNEIAIRVNWPGTTSDLDWLLLNKPAAGATVVSTQGSARVTSLMEDEFETIAVKPNTAYWLWVGGWGENPVTPVTYDATICGQTFTAP
ncbi:MAG: hypothetical protein IPQ07_14170 [Myxococcales bacterium]|nr:hypothetical protein [Myxococcales bacterium]